MGNQPAKIYLKDYTPPAYQVESIDLDIRLFDECATVGAVLKMQTLHFASVPQARNRDVFVEDGPPSPEGSLMVRAVSHHGVSLPGVLCHFV